MTVLRSFCRLIMSNIFTYGWKVKVDPASMQAALRGISSPDDAITWGAVLGCMMFYVAALTIERLGVALLGREAKVKGLFRVLAAVLHGLLRCVGCTCGGLLCSGACMSSPDDAVTWGEVLGCMMFYVAALTIERLGVALLQREAKERGQFT
jgi:hypothetical protein